MFDQPVDSPDEILLMNPGNKLTAIAGWTTDSSTDQSQKRIEYTAWIRAQRHCRAKLDLPRIGRLDFIDGAFPSGSDFNTKRPCIRPCIRRSRFITAKNPGFLVIRRIVPVCIN